MKRGERVLVALVGLAALVLFGGCSGKTLVESDLGVKGAPDWVNEGTQMLNDRGGASSTASGRPRRWGTSRSRSPPPTPVPGRSWRGILTSYLDVVSTDYTAAVGSGGGAPTSSP